jgi:radical SAM modification target selenobiotic family peptide
VEKKDLKKLLAGISIASLLTGGTLMISGCQTTS